MKYTSKFIGIAVVALAIVFIACDKGKTSGNDPVPPALGSSELSTDLSGQSANIQDSSKDSASGIGEMEADLAGQAANTQDSTKTSVAKKVCYATSNLRLRSEPDTSKDNRIATVSEGSSVEVLEAGKTENIDGINAPWYKVKTADGTTGWVFGGYLSARDYSKIAKGDLSDFAGNCVNSAGQSRQLRANGTFNDGEIAGGFKRDENPALASGGACYLWGVNTSDGSGYAVVLFPVGVEVKGYTGIIPTDTTKVRLTTGHDLPSSIDAVFYLEGK